MLMRCAHLEETRKRRDAAASRRKVRIEKAAPAPFAPTRPAIPGTLVPGQEVSDG
jgi:hypothetical protein